MALLEKILIVEDSLSQLDLMCYYLRDSVYRIIKATSAQQALKIALQEELDLIITDVVMPQMSGFELCRFLKKNPATQKVPIVICSSKNQKVDRLWGMKQGAVAYVSKPFSREQLLRAIESVAVEI
ncbi:response regulator receiver, CheY [Kalymmatonema gypsitolerans NIES-4073]|nr:response regulator receiver, CheY [Scytonema sp. NIES-4073]